LLKRRSEKLRERVSYVRYWRRSLREFSQERFVVTAIREDREGD
jgi:hypothetical protein